MIAVLWIWLAWQAAPNNELLQHVKAGMAARQAGNLKEAVAEFRKVTELAPTLPAAFVNLGAVELQDRDYAEATKALQRALQLQPDLTGAEQLLGYSLLAQGYAADALPHLEKAGDPGALGIAQEETGHFPDAIQNLSKALEQHPGDPDLLYYLGRASGLLSKQNFDTLLATQPDSARAHLAEAENLAVLRRVPEAEKEFQAALRLRPDLPGAHLELGKLYQTASDWTQAEREFRAAAQLEPGDAEAAYRLGSALLEEGKPKEARVALDRSNSLLPKMPETLYSLGQAASMEGDAAAAEQAWNEQLAVEDHTPLAKKAHFGLATLYRKQGKTAEAAKQMEEFRGTSHP